MTCCSASNVSRSDQHDEADMRARTEEDALLQASQKQDGGTFLTEFIVPDMHCVACIGSLERGLSRLPHVESVRANLSTRTVSVVWDPKQGKSNEIGEAISNLGFAYSVHEDEEAETERLSKKGRKLLLSIAISGFAAANIMLLSISVWSGADAETAQLFHLISGLIALPAVAYAGQPFFTSALTALSVRRLNMDVPISLAILLALGMSLYESLTGGQEAYFDAAVMLTFFLLIGRYLDHLMRAKARGAVQRLARLSAKNATLVEDDGSLRTIPLSDVTIGMHLRIHPGDRVPVNGEIISGSTDVDRSLVTGESQSISCAKGDSLEAGILNQTGSIDIRATSTAQNSYLSEILKMMQAAEKGRGRYVRIADRAARIYAPAVHLLALATFIGWMIQTGGNWHDSIYTAIAVLIITCPCALGLAVPIVHVVGANRLFREGILIRDGSAFERLARVDTVIFDKTGTLTMGKPVVTDVKNLREQDQPIVHALASRSSHPSAKAIAASLTTRSAFPLANVKEVPGFGMETLIDGQRVRFGRAAWVAELAGAEAEICDDSSVWFARENWDKTTPAQFVPARFILEDQQRPGLMPTVNDLTGQGLNLQMLSGDHQSAVARLANKLGPMQFTAEATPAEKIERINHLRNGGQNVLMVGDGLNDAPALAAANVSIAPSSASDIGRMAADFVFTRPNLSAVVEACNVARATGRLVRQNFAIAIFYNCIAVPLAMAGMITPLIAAISMSVSSLVVISNSMRLNWTRFAASSINPKAGIVGTPTRAFHSLGNSEEAPA